jgi:hypothetical protein
MASTITAGNATNGLALSCDNTGILELKTGTGAGTTAVTIDASQNVTLATGIAGDFKMNSGYGSVATAYGCRAWVKFNGVGTIAISASGNVSSITDNGTGDYTINFTSSMPDGNYSFAGSGGNATGTLPLYALMPYSNAMLTGSCRFHVNFVSGTAEDPIFVAALIIR